MIGLDTNVVVRYLAQDDPAQGWAAARLIDSLSPEAPGFLSLVVVAELVWVLESAYHFRKRDLEEVLEGLLRSKEVIVEQAEIVWQALRKFKAGRADFADCVIERCGHAAGCQSTVTFDQQAATAGGVRLLK